MISKFFPLALTAHKYNFYKLINNFRRYFLFSSLLFGFRPFSQVPAFQLFSWLESVVTRGQCGLSRAVCIYIYIYRKCEIFYSWFFWWGKHYETERDRTVPQVPQAVTSWERDRKYNYLTAAVLRVTYIWIDLERHHAAGVHTTFLNPKKSCHALTRALFYIRPSLVQQRKERYGAFFRRGFSSLVIVEFPKICVNLMRSCLHGPSINHRKNVIASESSIESITWNG